MPTYPNGINPNYSLPAGTDTFAAVSKPQNVQMPANSTLPPSAWNSMTAAQRARYAAMVERNRVLAENQQQQQQQTNQNIINQGAQAQQDALRQAMGGQGFNGLPGWTPPQANFQPQPGLQFGSSGNMTFPGTQAQPIGRQQQYDPYSGGQQGMNNALNSIYQRRGNTNPELWAIPSIIGGLRVPGPQMQNYNFGISQPEVNFRVPQQQNFGSGYAAQPQTPSQQIQSNQYTAAGGGQPRPFDQFNPNQFAQTQQTNGFGGGTGGGGYLTPQQVDMDKGFGEQYAGDPGKYPAGGMSLMTQAGLGGMAMGGLSGLLSGAMLAGGQAQDMWGDVRKNTDKLFQPLGGMDMNYGPLGGSAGMSKGIQERTPWGEAPMPNFNFNISPTFNNNANATAYGGSGYGGSSSGQTQQPRQQQQSNPYTPLPQQPPSRPTTNIYNPPYAQPQSNPYSSGGDNYPVRTYGINSPDAVYQDNPQMTYGEWNDMGNGYENPYVPNVPIYGGDMNDPSQSDPWSWWNNNVGNQQQDYGSYGDASGVFNSLNGMNLQEQQWDVPAPTWSYSQNQTGDQYGIPYDPYNSSAGYYGGENIGGQYTPFTESMYTDPYGNSGQYGVDNWSYQSPSSFGHGTYGQPATSPLQNSVWDSDPWGTLSNDQGPAYNGFDWESPSYSNPNLISNQGGGGNMWGDVASMLAPVMGGGYGVNNLNGMNMPTPPQPMDYGYSVNGIPVQSDWTLQTQPQSMLDQLSRGARSLFSGGAPVGGSRSQWIAPQPMSSVMSQQNWNAMTPGQRNAVYQGIYANMPPPNQGPSVSQMLDQFDPNRYSGLYN